MNKGLDLPIKGEPAQRIDFGGEISRVAVIGSDFIGLKPTMLVKEGDTVKCGDALFEDKKNPGVIITAPASGVVKEINRGEKRVLVSVVIDVKDDKSISFRKVDESELVTLSEDQVRQKLQKSGLWSAFRSRPYGKIPAIDSIPNSIFVTAIDTNPLSSDPAVVINEYKADYLNGLRILSRFGVTVYVCQAAVAKLPDANIQTVKTAHFKGPHPAGLPSTHIHCIDPVNVDKTVWHIGYQDVIATGKLFTTGKLYNKRIVALGGPMVNSPRLLETCIGADISEFLNGRTISGEKRIVSGSVFNGHIAEDNTAYLGRYDNQISVLREDRARQLFGWITPGLKKFSAINVFVSSLFKNKRFDITTSQNGSPRAIVPIGVFEKVMPLDILPTPLLKALLVKDSDSAQQLGCLELVEEDLALCSFVDPGKHDFGPVLRSNLTQIEREG